MLSSAFADSPEYITRKDTPFMPSKITWNELHSSLPKHIFRRSTVKGVSYVVRDVTLAIVLYRLAWFLESPATVFFIRKPTHGK
ncbi:hypothetical protein F5877DRAFT_84796 [Lentinula edodes]|nr:hypothetical protein F5877DRAFT_84796 [Lentinula edodes]